MLAGGGDAGRDQDPRPDLITGVDVSSTAGSLRDVSISTTVKNVGSGPSPESLCDVIFRNARPPRQVLKKVQQKIRELDPGDAYTFSFTITTGFGMYEVCAFADAKKSVDESDETNNRSCTMLEGK
jgi:hypothetical protein